MIWSADRKRLNYRHLKVRRSSNVARTLTLLSVTEVTTEMGGVGVDSRKRISMLSLLLAPPVETMNAQSAELSSTPQIVSTKESRVLVLQNPLRHNWSSRLKLSSRTVADGVVNMLAYPSATSETKLIQGAYKQSREARFKNNTIVQYTLVI